MTTADVTGDGIPDVLVTNGQSGTLATIPGLADVRGLATGAFDSSAIEVIKLSDRPLIQTQTGHALLAYAFGSVVVGYFVLMRLAKIDI